VTTPRHIVLDITEVEEGFSALMILFVLSKMGCSGNPEPVWLGV
jgi:hypothetical protein